jgi:hypothetical protein
LTPLPKLFAILIFGNHEQMKSCHRHNSIV